MTPEIRILSCDSQGAEVRLPAAEEKLVPVAFVEINDPEAPQEYSYYIGFEFLGPDLKNPSSWKYFCTIHWSFAQERKEQDNEYEPEQIPQEEIEEVLARHDSSLDKVLEEYCRGLKYPVV